MDKLPVPIEKVYKRSKTDVTTFGIAIAQPKPEAVTAGTTGDHADWMPTGCQLDAD
jgi:hypothetical protein